MPCCPRAAEPALGLYPQDLSPAATRSYQRTIGSRSCSIASCQRQRCPAQDKHRAHRSALKSKSGEICFGRSEDIPLRWNLVWIHKASEPDESIRRMYFWWKVAATRGADSRATTECSNAILGPTVTSERLCVPCTNENLFALPRCQISQATFPVR